MKNLIFRLTILFPFPNNFICIAAHLSWIVCRISLCFLLSVFIPSHSSIHPPLLICAMYLMYRQRTGTEQNRHLVSASNWATECIRWLHNFSRLLDWNAFPFRWDIGRDRKWLFQIWFWWNSKTTNVSMDFQIL